MNSGHLRAFNESFGIKIAAGFILSVFVISIAFTAFYIHHQQKTLTDALVDNGRMLAGILAHNSRIGVFSENDSLLEDPVDGVFQQQEVMEVSLFNLEGRLLKKQERPGLELLGETGEEDRKNRDAIFTELREREMALYLESGDRLEFWSPVISSSGFDEDEPLYFEAYPLKSRDRVIGYVRVTLGREALKRQLQDLLLRSILIGTLSLLIGSWATYIVVKRLTKPLNRLTEGVDTIRRGRDAEKVPVETEDEIGKLAKAFNEMTESLKGREEALKESEMRLRSLSSRLLGAQEQERSRLSKELHDGFGNDLALLKLRLRSIERKLPENGSSLRRDCEETNTYIDQIIENARRLSRDLSPSILEDLGLSAALRWQAENFAEQHFIEITLDMVDIDNQLPPDGQINLYRILQEALSNVYKHAEASAVTLAVKKEQDTISFLVEDDGIGFDVKGVNKGTGEKGMGLTTIRERARMLRGDIDIRSHPDRGTRITLEIPLEKEGGRGS